MLASDGGKQQASFAFQKNIRASIQLKIHFMCVTVKVARQSHFCELLPVCLIDIGIPEQLCVCTSVCLPACLPACLVFVRLSVSQPVCSLCVQY